MLLFREFKVQFVLSFLQSENDKPTVSNVASSQLIFLQGQGCHRRGTYEFVEILGLSDQLDQVMTKVSWILSKQFRSLLAQKS